MISTMKNADIVRAWISLGDAKPAYGEFKQAMTRRTDAGPYGFMSVYAAMEMVFREDFCCLYYRLMHMYYSRSVARMKAVERRPKYYAAENERRRALASERRKIRARRTVNARPTSDALLDAWEHRKDSHEAAIRFGSMLEDLECYLDNSLIRDEYGAIIGRNPGIKGWLFENVPKISEHYATAMRYKSAARKLKQIVELVDPTPVDVVLSAPGKDLDYGADEMSEDLQKDSEKTEENGEISSKCEECGGSENDKSGKLDEEVPPVEIVRAWAIWYEVAKDIRPCVTALMERLDALTDPERVEDANMLAAWRKKYQNKITVRTKSRWRRRLARIGRIAIRQGKRQDHGS